MRKEILIIEDDETLLSMISYNIKNNNFNVREAKNGEDALLFLKEKTPDLVLIDWMIPAPSGIEICKSIRRNKNTKDLPIIILTARGEEEDKVKGLESGADDYIVKPFSPIELIARINALLRRYNKSFVESSLEYSDIVMDLRQQKVYRSKKKIQLGPTEFKLLKHFLENPQRVFQREQLLDNVWGHGIYVELRTVDTHIRRLRKAINIGKLPNIIRTVRSFGYSLDSNQ